MPATTAAGIMAGAIQWQLVLHTGRTVWIKLLGSVGIRARCDQRAQDDSGESSALPSPHPAECIGSLAIVSPDESSSLPAEATLPPASDAGSV